MVSAAQDLHENVVPAVGISSYEFAKLLAGAFLFVGTSLMLFSALLPVPARLKKPVPVSAILDAALVGPLRLLVDAAQVDVEKLAWRLWVLVVLRGLLCSRFGG